MKDDPRLQKLVEDHIKPVLLADLDSLDEVKVVLIVQSLGKIGLNPGVTSLVCLERACVNLFGNFDHGQLRYLVGGERCAHRN